MIITSSGYFAGYRSYRLKGKQVWLWNLVNLERIKLEGPKVLAPVKHAIACDFKYHRLGVMVRSHSTISAAQDRAGLVDKAHY